MASKLLESIKYNGEWLAFDLDDVLDIIPVGNLYNLIFNDGAILINVKLKKSLINKFEKIKKGRNQK